VLIRVARGHFIMLFRKDKNPDYPVQIQNSLSQFGKLYSKYRFDYKIVIGNAVDEISRKNDYLNLITMIHHYMNDNTIHEVDDEDILRLNRQEVILGALGDIKSRHDLDDPRILVYCQPVFNVRTGKYDTAEALMRMQLKDLGMLFPDEFIPLAERSGHIHVLTEIILNKTCKIIRDMLDQGYDIQRISVNVSALEVSSDSFCHDITGIVEASGIPGAKVAIELTESQTDNDFLMMKNRIEELRSLGIKFYLDDFGTGYSNMERIMELPFDIIKFDRSMVLASDASEKSRKIVVGLADIFSEMHYSVLFEGVEGPAEEEMCIGMRASYLQGYKYSRPIPIEQLTQFFEKKAV
ncbi:MAG: EAL domain-containing protein, partial [Clostridia bacterium]|nr:EAL domain-containing protein [Clostridia bacterium]